MRGKYLCNNRYNNTGPLQGKCGGRVRTQGFECKDCASERLLEEGFRREYGYVGITKG